MTDKKILEADEESAYDLVKSGQYAKFRRKFPGRKFREFKKAVFKEESEQVEESNEIQIKNGRPYVSAFAVIDRARKLAIADGSYHDKKKTKLHVTPEHMSRAKNDLLRPHGLAEASKMSPEEASKPFNYDEWKASSVKKRALPGYGKKGGITKMVAAAKAAGMYPKLKTEETITEAKHRIQVTISDPNASAVSQRQEKIQKFIRIPGKHSDEAAMTAAAKHYRSQGYKVHGVEHVGMVESEQFNESLKQHSVWVSYHKKSDPDRKFEARFKTTHSGGKEETERRAKEAFAAKGKVAYGFVHESAVTTHSNPLVTVFQDGSLHTHANLSTANSIHGTSVKAPDVHKGKVSTKNRDGKSVVFGISKHHASEVRESVEQMDESTDEIKSLEKKLSQQKRIFRQYASAGGPPRSHPVYKELRTIRVQLLKARDAVNARARAQARAGQTSESVEQMDELSSDTLKSYSAAAKADASKLTAQGAKAKKVETSYAKFKKATKRFDGAAKADKKSFAADWKKRIGA